MSKDLQDPLKKPKIFKKFDIPAFLTASKPLYHLSLLQVSKYEKNKQKEWFFRVYDDFMLISNVIIIKLPKNTLFFIRIPVFAIAKSQNMISKRE